MSTRKDLENTHILEFKKRVEIGIQQEKSYLRHCLTEEICEKAEASAIREVFGAREATIIEGDLEKTDFGNTRPVRRWIRYQNAGWAERIDAFARLDSGINPFNPYSQLASAALQRVQDNIILEGMLGTNRVGKLGDEIENFSPDNILPMSGAKGPITATLIGQLINAKAWWLENDVDLSSERLYVGLPADVWASMFSLEQARSKDYIDKASLIAGEIQYFAGFHFVNMEIVPGKAKFPEKIKKEFPTLRKGVKYVLPCWCASGVVFAQRKSITASHSKNPEIWDAPQLLVTASFGATRVEPKKVLGIEISDESITFTSPTAQTTTPASKSTSTQQVDKAA